MKKKSIVFKIIITLIALFAIYNVYWLIFSYIRWKPLCEQVGYNEQFKDYSKFVGELGEYDRYLFYVSLPRYLSFEGNLSIAQTAVPGDARPTVDMLIFPEIGGYRIETQIITHKSSESEVVLEVGGRVILNENMEFYDEPTEEEKELFEKYNAEIKHAFDIMRSVWDLK